MASGTTSYSAHSSTPDPMAALRESTSHITKGSTKFHMVHGQARPPFIRPETYSTMHERFSSREDDIIVVTMPKSGTTWMQQVVLLLLHDGDPSTFTLRDHAPWPQQILGQKATQLKESNQDSSWVEVHNDAWECVHHIWDRPSPRVFKSHDPVHLLKFDSKKICVLRNPKDTMVSLFHQLSRRGIIDVDWNDFFALYMTGKMPFGDYFDHSNAWIKAARSTPDKVLLLTYEAMHAKPELCIAEVADFIGVQLTPELLQKVIRYSQFTTMQQHTPGYEREFFRKGQTGDWENYFSSSQAAIMDHRIRNELDGEFGW